MLVDAVGTTFGALIGTSTVTSYVESSAGIESGARTGLSSVVVGLLFLVTIALFPIFNIFIYSSALTSMALVLVGVLMFVQIKDIDWKDTPVIIASFLIIIAMMLTYSIGTGIAFGFIFYVLSMMVQRRFKEVNPVMYVLAAAFVAYFAVNAIF
jgi:AGZA family xanthine/uracil permease-like MFS transporter